MKKIILIALLAINFSCNTKTNCKNYIYIQRTPISYTHTYGFVDKGSHLYELGDNKQLGFYIQAFRNGEKVNEALIDTASFNATIELMKAQILFKDSTICL